MLETFVKFEFNYASFILNPFKGDKSNSNQLLKKIILKLNEPDFPSNLKVIDRHRNRKNAPKRQLVIISNRFTREGLRCFGRIALIKNKTPLVLVGKNVIEEIEKEENRQYIEITNYVIHFNTDSDPVIMHEFNSEGPRLSDIEFYFRQITNEFKLAKNINNSLHLDTNFEQLDRDLKNVFGVTVKINSAYTNRANWLTALRNLNEESGYKDVRLELFFKRRKKKDGKYERNIQGTDFARNLISWLRQDGKNIKYLEDLKMSYQVNDDDVIDLDFLKNKVVSIVNVPLTGGKLYKTDDFTTLVAEEFNYYLRTGKTNKE